MTSIVTQQSIESLVDKWLKDEQVIIPKQITQYVKTYSPLQLKESCPVKRGVYCICENINNEIKALYIGYSDNIYKRITWHLGKTIKDSNKFIVIFENEDYKFERWLTMTIIPEYQSHYKNLGKRRLHNWFCNLFKHNISMLFTSLFLVKQENSNRLSSLIDSCYDHYRQSEKLRKFLKQYHTFLCVV